MSNVQKKKTKKSKKGSARKASSPKTENTVPVAIAVKQTTKKPKIQFTNGEVRVRHKELVMNLTGSLGWEIQAGLPIQPGSGVTFPWLSKTFGRGYEQYRINNISCEYVTRCGTAVPGSISIIPDYDPDDKAPITEFVASTYQNVVEDAVWKNVTCKLDPVALAAGRTRHFTRTQPLGGDKERKAYDCGTIYIATSDNASDAVAVGKIWVKYDISFYIPQLPPDGSDEIVGGQIRGTEAMSPSNPLGTASVDGNSVGLAIGNTDPPTMYINSPGTYLVSLSLTGTAVTAGGFSIGPGIEEIGASGIADGSVLFVILTIKVMPGYETGSNYLLLPPVTCTSVASCNIYIASAPENSLTPDFFYNKVRVPSKQLFDSKKSKQVIPAKCLI